MSCDENSLSVRVCSDSGVGIRGGSGTTDATTSVGAPYDEEDGEKLCAAADQERGADGRWTCRGWRRKGLNV